MPTRSIILNEIESCCHGHFYKKSRREKGEKGFEEGERERRWIEKRKKKKCIARRRKMAILRNRQNLIAWMKQNLQIHSNIGI